MKELKFKITGITPMLMNNVESMYTAKEKPARMKPEEWEQTEKMFTARQYLDEKGAVSIPARVWKGMLKEASKQAGIKQKGKRSGYADLVGATVFINAGVTIEHTGVQKHPAYVGMNGTKKVLRLWPKLEEWSGVLSVTLVDESRFEPEIFTEILDFAGKFVGLGDYRPEFGRFTIKQL